MKLSFELFMCTLQFFLLKTSLNKLLVTYLAVGLCFLLFSKTTKAIIGIDLVVLCDTEGVNMFHVHHIRICFGLITFMLFTKMSPVKPDNTTFHLNSKNEHSNVHCFAFFFLFSFIYVPLTPYLAQRERSSLVWRIQSCVFSIHHFSCRHLLGRHALAHIIVCKYQN